MPDPRLLLFLGAAASAAASTRGGQRDGVRGVSVDRSGRGPVCRVAPWPATPTDANDEHCPVCQERYRDFRPNVSRQDALSALKDWRGEQRWDTELAVSEQAIMACRGALKQSLWRERHGGCVSAPADRFADFFDDVYEEMAASEWKRDRKGRLRLYGPPREVCFTRPTPGCFTGRDRLPNGREFPPHGGSDCRGPRGRYKKC